MKKKEVRPKDETLRTSVSCDNGLPLRWCITCRIVMISAAMEPRLCLSKGTGQSNRSGGN